MQCSDCRKDLENDAEFCYFCGAILTGKEILLPAPEEIAELGMPFEGSGNLCDKGVPAFDLLKLPAGVTYLRMLRGHTSWIGRIAWSQDGRLIASPSDDATVRVWDAKGGKCLHVLIGHRGSVCAAAFDYESRIIATAGNDHTLRFWSASTGRLIHTVETQTVNYCVAFDPKGRVLATAGEGGVRLWEPDGELVATLEQRQHSFFPSAAFDHEGELIACASSDECIYLFEFPSCQLLTKFTDHDSPVNWVDFSVQDDQLISASADKTLMLWDLREDRLVRKFEGHTGEAYYASFARTSNLIASKGGDSVRLWNPEDGACVAISGGSCGVWLPGLSFHPTKNLLATVGSAPGIPERTKQCDRVIHIWELEGSLFAS
ncbi:MAG TPA: WD40 repeat domain-containing protein [Candidatus Angelobacter sp.]|nr:WD40 repeat domain-containing protein [Candidatus Angelobacter sp.]